MQEYLLSEIKVEEGTDINIGGVLGLLLDILQKISKTNKEEKSICSTIKSRL